MQKIITKWWWLIAAILLGGLYIYGYREMFFHQDDLDWMIMMNRPLRDVIMAPIGDHVDYLFRILFKTEWELFRLNFPLYLAVSVAMHAGVTLVLYLLTKALTKRDDLPAIVALIFTINTNWTESVLWISGQTISITALFVLVAMYALWKKKGETAALFLASWTSALAMGLLGATFITYKNKRWLVAAILAIVGIIYYFLGTDGTRLEISWRWVGQVIMVAGLMMINSVVGRLFIPFDRFEIIRIAGVVVLVIVGLYKWRGELQKIWQDQWSRFLVLQLVFYNLIVAVGRAQYGVGIMRAERYAYLGLVLFLLLGARILRKWQVGKWIWMVPFLIIIQSVGFYIRARAYVERPQQMKTLFAQIRKDPSAIDANAYLPHFVFNDERLRYSDLLGLMNH